jgi:hypothetical protein
MTGDGIRRMAVGHGSHRPSMRRADLDLLKIAFLLFAAARAFSQEEPDIDPPDRRCHWRLAAGRRWFDLMEVGLGSSRTWLIGWFRMGKDVARLGRSEELSPGLVAGLLD